MIWLVFILVIAFSLAFLLKIINLIYIKQREQTYNNSQKEFEGFLTAKPSYSEFRKVASESLGPNGPIRKKDDCLGFLIDSINKKDNSYIVQLFSMEESDE